ncbi:MAG: TrkH family potassium uptake protein [Sedimentisphaerales bacterium]|nr:TrkH family potassium uptake protein [Sedimentisphaerales bacterium]
MNYRQIIRQLGTLVLLVGACMASALVWAVLDRAQADSGRIVRALVLSVCLCAAAGLACWKIGRRAAGEILRKEAIAIVGFGWLLCGVLGSLPFIFSGVLGTGDSGLSHVIASALFESFSGFTTTGASVFPSPQDLPRAILFWRSLTHWLGGMGIVVLFVALLGGTGAGAKFLFSSEVPGPIAESLRPRIRSTALLLWKIYLGISAAEVACLLVQGINLFEALCHTFGTMATGGFSTLNGSIGQYHDLGIEITVIVFMILAGTNFNLHAALLQRRWRMVLRNKELRIYLLLLAAATALLTTDLIVNRSGQYSPGRALRDAGFQAVSIMTTTGYGTTDFDQWPSLSRWLLVMLMFIGGSAGSTGGGIKVIRIMIFARLVWLEVERTFRPHVVRPLKVSGQTLDEDLRRSFGLYMGIILVIFFLGTVLLMVLHNEAHVEEHRYLNLETAFSAVAATLNNIGPGLSMVGPTQNYAFFTSPAKILLALLMVIGRLEVMVIFCLFVPNFYRRN